MFPIDVLTFSEFMKKSAVKKNGAIWITVKKDVRNWSESLNNDVRNC
jgi:hypothetical protein